MKRPLRALSLLLCACLLLTLLGGCRVKPETDPEETTVADPDYSAEYSRAITELEDRRNLVMNLIVDEKRTVGNTTLSEQISRTAQFADRGTEDMTAVITDKVLLNPVSYVYELVYRDGTVSVDLSGGKYYSELDEETFLADQVPPVMLDPERYASVTGEVTNRGTTVLTFSGAGEAEDWAMPVDGELVEASGTATLGADGSLSGATYKITYRFGGSTIFTSYQCNYSYPETLDLSEKVPEMLRDYTRLEDYVGAIVLLRAYHALSMASVISTTATETYYTAAGNFAEIRNIQTHVYDDGGEFWEAQDATTSYYDYSDNSQQVYHSEAQYHDGVETYILEGEEETYDLTDDEVRQYIRLSRMGYIIAPGLISAASITDLGDYYLIEFEGTEACGEAVKSNICEMLFGDEDLLDNAAEAYETTEISGYLGVEKYTYLPTSYSLQYSGVHTIEGGSYPLVFHADLSFSLCDPDTYLELTGEPLPDVEPEQKASPVFYEVAGPSGEKLYLFGTIHVGDDRTAYLPQCIYDAFDSSDAVAVEFDTDAFFESIDENEELQRTIAETYYYTDGTKAADHLDEELYEDAVKVMKVAGKYGQAADQLRVNVWSSMIDNFYLSQGRRLASSKGVDERLLKRAREAEKEILNVESGEFQLQMMAGYSDQVQEMMLAESVYVARNNYLASIYRLYDSWCEGDEAALIQRLAAMSDEERAEIESEDLAVYDEYHQTMEVGRNRNMLEVAKGYLESGKTVFFAVGLVHLLGEAGLVDALREAGYTVTLVDTKQG